MGDGTILSTADGLPMNRIILGMAGANYLLVAATAYLGFLSRPARSGVAVAEDYGLVDKIHRGLKAGIERKVIIGRNEPGVQNMHRQLQDLLPGTKRPL